MFFNLCFPAIDPWSDLEELLTPPEPADADRAPPPAARAAAPQPSPLARPGGESAPADPPRSR